MCSKVGPTAQIGLGTCALARSLYLEHEIVKVCLLAVGLRI